MTPWFFPLVCWQNLGRWYHLIWRRYHLIWPNCWSYLGGRQANKSRLFRATLGLGRPDCVSLELADADIFTFNLALLIRDRVVKSPLNKQYCKLLKRVTKKVLICVQACFFTLQSYEKVTNWFHWKIWRKPSSKFPATTTQPRAPRYLPGTIKRCVADTWIYIIQVFLVSFDIISYHIIREGFRWWENLSPGVWHITSLHYSFLAACHTYFEPSGLDLLIHIVPPKILIQLFYFELLGCIALKAWAYQHYQSCNELFPVIESMGNLDSRLSQGSNGTTYSHEIFQNISW